MLDEIFGEVPNFEAHVFVAGHSGVEVEIFDVNSPELGSRGGDDTVEEELHFEEIGGGLVTVMWVVYWIAANDEMRALGITLLWSVVDHNPIIGDISPACGGDIGLFYEKYGVCAFD